MINAKYVEMEKVIATAQLGNIVTTPISTMAVSRIPGNTASSSTGVTSGAIPVPSITASKTTATAGETITFNWVANDPAPENCKTITNNVTQEPPYLQ